MPDQILVTYASRYGSTAGVAAEVARTLTDAGCAAIALPMREVNSLSPYRAVVAGSAINRYAWLPEALDFVGKNQLQLGEMPFAIFSVCITLASRDDPQTRSKIRVWLDPVRALVRPVSEEMFAGVLDIPPITPGFERFLFRLLVRLGQVKEGDFRNWPAIRAWAASLPPLLAGRPSH